MDAMLQAPRTQLLNELWLAQLEKGYIADEDIDGLAEWLDVSRIEVEGVASFYHFFHRKPAGKYTIYCNNSVTAMNSGMAEVIEAFSEACDTSVGSTDHTGTFGLFLTPCIGLSDQEPAALINFFPFTHLNPAKVKRIVERLKRGEDPATFFDRPENQIRFTPSGKASIFFGEFSPGSVIRRLPQWGRQGVIEALKATKLSGRGGAFFPTWRKWQAAADQPSTTKVVVCNADEGEPGTFKDRVLMNKVPETMLAGMAACAYSVGASYGIIYLRGEYRWLESRLHEVIEEYRRESWLGKNAGGIQGFNFDVRIQIGAGAYVCGEETALLESMEGKRGEPRTKWYFPVERGYLQHPTVINNVETFCAAARILQSGVDRFLDYGLPGSPGTKLISVSGDCQFPGIYEIEWGMTLGELLDQCGAKDAWVIQESGPSGNLLSVEERHRPFGMDHDGFNTHIRCGGALTIFNTQRNLLEILLNYAAFYKHESCGICTPCRAGNFIIQRKLERIHKGLADLSDLKDLQQWGQIMRTSSRCGLGKTATNSLLNALKKFPGYFESCVDPTTDSQNLRFDLEAATREYEAYKPQ
jgi:[NiFe] hydrogenase diaphorase moiety large subunit